MKLTRAETDESTPTPRRTSSPARKNPSVESFHSRVRDELLDDEQIACVAEARVVIED
jgi:hypothetical protein